MNFSRKKPIGIEKFQEKVLNKQKLEDLEHKINADVGAFLLLDKEGTQEQVLDARQKAKSDFHKFGHDMYEIALKIGGDYPEFIEEYLESIDDILHSPIGWIDNSQINHYFKMIDKLEKELYLD